MGYWVTWIQLFDNINHKIRTLNMSFLRFVLSQIIYNLIHYGVYAEITFRCDQIILDLLFLHRELTLYDIMTSCDPASKYCVSSTTEHVYRRHNKYNNVVVYRYAYCYAYTEQLFYRRTHNISKSIIFFKMSNYACT